MSEWPPADFSRPRNRQSEAKANPTDGDGIDKGRENGQQQKGDNQVAAPNEAQR